MASSLCGGYWITQITVYVPAADTKHNAHIFVCVRFLNVYEFAGFELQLSPIRLTMLQTRSKIYACKRRFIGRV